MTDDHDNTPENGAFPPESLLPYERWLEDAYRGVMLSALEYVSREGLAGEHHFYLTFRTDFPGVEIPARLRAQYPHEMTIVLQHQFWDLKVDHAEDTVSVGLSFGGVGSILVIPVRAFTGFADPSIQLSLHFMAEEPDEADAPVAEQPSDAATGQEGSGTAESDGSSQVVSLDAFRKKGPSPA
ncbi:SspB family protein [Acetobacter indonesiensis]|uniref:SspB family protein n=1 Tax=Acetobacter indonesiensis TaxID=104101 RepID=UPI0039EB5339